MEIYLLITGVVTFIGVICVVVWLEKASKASAERFQKERENAAKQMQSLATIHALIETTQGQTNAILTALQSLQAQSISLLKAQDASSAKQAEEALAGDGRTCSKAHVERVSILKRAGWKISHVPYYRWYRNGWALRYGKCSI